jgi:hypothetical protein
MALHISLTVAIALVALTAAVALWYSVREAAPPSESAPSVARAQRKAQRYGVLLGIVEGGALLAVLVALFSVPSGSSETWVVGLAALCVALMLTVWAAWLRPLNLTIAGWRPDAPPDDWTKQRARWSRLHRVRILFAVVALALLIMGLFPSSTA